MRSRLLIFRGFSDDSQCVLTRIERLAFVFVKLLMQVCLRVRWPFDGIHRSIEVFSTSGTNSHGRCAAEPFDYAQTALPHVSQCPTTLAAIATPVEIK